MATKNIVVLDWPANSPDLNIIEHLWPRLKEAVGKHLRDSIEKPTKATLEQFIRTSWTECCTTDILKNLYASMPLRVANCIANKGGHTEY